MTMHHDHAHGDGDAAAAAGITAGMMMAILAFIAAIVIVFALLVWTPWNDGSGTSTNNITNNPVPSQPSNNLPGGGNNSGGGTNNSSGGTNPQPGSGGSSSGGSSSGGSSNTPR